MRIAKFPNVSHKVSWEKIIVTRDGHDGQGSPEILEKRKRLKDLSPPLTKDTILFFGLRETNQNVVEAQEVKENSEREMEEVKQDMEQEGEGAKGKEEETEKVDGENMEMAFDAMSIQRDEEKIDIENEKPQESERLGRERDTEVMEAYYDPGSNFGCQQIVEGERTLPAKDLCIKMLKATWPVLDSFDVTVGDICWNMRNTNKEYKFTKDQDRDNQTTASSGHSFTVDLSKGPTLSGSDTHSCATKELAVSKEVVAQFVTFKVKKLTLVDDALRKVIAIGSLAGEHIQQEEEAAKFLKEVPMEISCPTFGIGGWFRATTEVN